jgi:hypothetical protein
METPPALRTRFFAVLIVAVVVGVAWVGLTIAANIGIDVSLPNWTSR